jgi:hypothetical protein
VKASSEAVIERACTRKARLGMRTAQRLARWKRVEGHEVSAYRCPFCGSWHVGHVPSVEGLEQLARAIRDQHGNAPGEVDQ